MFASVVALALTSSLYAQNKKKAVPGLARAHLDRDILRELLLAQGFDPDSLKPKRVQVQEEFPGWVILAVHRPV